MKYEQAYKECKTFFENDGIGELDGVAFNMALNALEKQIPKKPINKTKCDNSTAKRFENCNIVVCPLCNGRLKLKSKGKHCDKCGQALDWGDSNG